VQCGCSVALNGGLLGTALRRCSAICARQSTADPPVPDIAGDAAQKTISAFHHSKLVRTAADRCLPRSIALALGLAAHCVRAHVVIGVRIAPFGAHCWVQAGNEILNESVEEVLLYTPILAI